MSGTRVFKGAVGGRRDSTSASPASRRRTKDVESQKMPHPPTTPRPQVTTPRPQVTTPGAGSSTGRPRARVRQRSISLTTKPERISTSGEKSAAIQDGATTEILMLQAERIKKKIKTPQNIKIISSVNSIVELTLTMI